MDNYIVTSTDDVIVVTINNIPNDMFYISKVFNMIAKSNISLDMINSCISVSDKFSVSFSTGRENTEKIIKILKELKQYIPLLYTEISSDNTKIKIYNKSHDKTIYLTSILIDFINKYSEIIKMITTSENEVSIITESNNWNKKTDELNRILTDL